MKILVFGSNGMLGTYLTSYFSKIECYDVIPITRRDIDLSKSSKEEIIKFIESKSLEYGDCIINASGLIKQRDVNLIDMIVVNSIFPNILAEVKKIINVEVIHITTDCVFSGKSGNYNESDEHDCVDEYGKSKSLGENMLLTNLRTSIIGEEDFNKKSLLEWVRSKSNSEIDGYENHIWNGVTCLELCKLIDEIIKNKKYWRGVRHIFSPNSISKYDLVSYINEIYELNIKINKVSTKYNCYRNLNTYYENLVSKNIYEQIVDLKNYKK